MSSQQEPTAVAVAVASARAYRRALELAPTDAERRFIRRRLSELTEERHR